MNNLRAGNNTCKIKNKQITHFTYSHMLEGKITTFTELLYMEIIARNNTLQNFKECVLEHYNRSG